MQNLLKITNMTLVCGRRREHLKLAICVFFHVNGKISGDPGRPVQPVALPVDVKKYKITNFKCFLYLSEAPTPKKEVIFLELNMKFCIGGCQNLKVGFSRFAALFSLEYVPLFFPVLSQKIF